MAGISQISPAYSRQNCLKSTVLMLGGGFDDEVIGGISP
jgi:hypothetical protein